MQHDRKDYNDRIQDSLPEAEGGIPEKEPVFLLRGQDQAAATIVRAWARVVASMGGDEETIRSALKQADRMEAWAQEVKGKVPDL